MTLSVPLGFRSQLVILATIGLTGLAGACTLGPAPAAQRENSAQDQPVIPAEDAATTAIGWGSRPNVLIVLTDDQSFNAFNRDLMPRVFNDLVDRGVSFSRAYVNQPLCCPSRSSILTGLYAHNTGVDLNSRPLERPELARPTFPPALREVGYRTIMSGKYLNSENCDPRPGWDRWLCGEQEKLTQVNPVLNVDGIESAFQGNSVDLLADPVIDFITGARADGVPFLAYYAPKTPHLPGNINPSFVPSFYDPPSFGFHPEETRRQPYYARAVQKEKKRAGMRQEFVEMARTIPPMDSAIGRILDAIGPDMENTFVIFLSDNGYLYGEHDIGGKGSPYEESTRVPMVVRYPALVPSDQPSTTDALVSNVDIAPTITQLAGVEWTADGVSLTPLLAQQAPAIRDAILLESCKASDPEDEKCRRLIPPPFWGIVTNQYTYFRYDSRKFDTEEEEIYDLAVDPYQMENLADRDQYVGLRDQLFAQLEALRAPRAVPDTTIALGPGPSTSEGTAYFQVFSQDRTTALWCQLEGPGQAGEWSPCETGRVTYSGLGAGDYVFRAQAVNSLGVPDPTPAERKFAIA